MQRGQEVDEHDHHLCLKLLSPDELRRLLDRSGFTLMQEFGSCELGPWTSDADKWIVLATKEE